MPSLHLLLFWIRYSWQQALAMVFICGLINIFITVTKIRKMIIHAIPESLQNAIGGGIGIFVAYVGIKNAGFLSFQRINQQSLVLLLKVVKQQM